MANLSRDDSPIARIPSGRHFEIGSLLRAHYGIMFSKMATDFMAGATELLNYIGKRRFDTQGGSS
jgi:hypothetical protein